MAKILTTISDCCEPQQKFYAVDKLRNFSANNLLVQRLEDEDFNYTYDEIIKQVTELNKKLSLHNVATEATGIGIQFEDHTPATCALLLTILNRGCHFYVVDPKLSLQKQIETLTAMGVTYVISKEARKNDLLQLDIYKEQFFVYPMPAPEGDKSIAMLPAHMCYTIATTGSTGAAKMVHVPYTCIAPNICALSARLQVKSADVIYLGTPVTFDPFIVEFFLALHNGATLLLCSATLRLTPAKLIETLWPSDVAKLACTVLQSTPALFRRFGADVIRQRILCIGSALRILLLGGEAFPALVELRTWLTDSTLKHKLICNIYGITELSCWATIHICQTLFGAAECVPLGVPIERDTKLRIVAQTGNTSEATDTGVLWLGSANRRCYIPHLDGTKPNEDSPELYRSTGDLVTRDEQGNIYYIGRSNDVIKRAGKRLCLASLGQKIHQAIKPVIDVICLWHAETEKLFCVLHVAGKLTKQAEQKQKLVILALLAGHEQPDSFSYVRNLPLNKHGKVDKCALLAQCQEQRRLDEPLDLFKSFLSETLCLDLAALPVKNAASSNKCAKFAYDATFRQVGGSSYHALSLATELGQHMACATQQRKLLEMLVHDAVSIGDIIEFLRTVKRKPKYLSTHVTDKLASRRTYKFCQEWRVNFAKCIDAGVSAYNSSYIVVGAHSKLLQTLDAASGNVVASLSLPDRIECKVSWVHAELALVGCYDGRLYAFQPRLGAVLWSHALGGMIKAQPLIDAAGELVLVGSYAADFNVACISLQSHELCWRQRIGSKGIYAAPLDIAADRVIICALDGSYACLSFQNGHVHWLQKCASPIFSSPVLLPHGQCFALAEVAGCVHICDVASGKSLLTYKAEGNIFSSFALTQRGPNESLLLFGCHDAQVYCLCYLSDATTESLKLHWRTKLNGPVFATPVLVELTAGLHVFCCSTPGVLALLQLNEGALLATHSINGELFSSACCTNDSRIYFGCRDNYLYCFGIKAADD